MQKTIINQRYVFDLTQFNFVPKTIIIVAAKFELVGMTFNYQGKSVTDFYCVDQSWVNDKMKQVFTENGYNLESIYWLPQKRLAVCSGLAEYGRNNIAYIDEWGSFFGLQTYVTDAPCGEDYNFRDVRMMEICETCGVCIKSCPTKAIKDDKYLIDCRICLCYLVELEKPFPDWLPKSVIHSVYGCYKCQDVCPRNKQALSNITERIEFSEEETAMFLAGARREDMPATLVEKIERLGIQDWRLELMPKNLGALLENAG